MGCAGCEDDVPPPVPTYDLRDLHRVQHSFLPSVTQCFEPNLPTAKPNLPTAKPTLPSVEQSCALEPLQSPLQEARVLAITVRQPTEQILVQTLPNVKPESVMTSSAPPVAADAQPT